MTIFWHTVYILVFIFTANWAPILLFISSLRNPRETSKVIVDKALFNLLKQKAGIKISSIKILNSKKFFGMMIGIPTKPILIMSRNVYERFNKDEIEYVILHEIGHYILGHSVKLAVLQIIFIIIGLSVLLSIPTQTIYLVLAPFFAVIFGIIYIQIARITEYEADNYALKKIKDPKGMITASKKFRAANTSVVVKHSLLGKLFSVGVPYSQRIKMAEWRLGEVGR